MKKVSQVIVVVVIAVGLFSCNVIDITKKRYSNGYYISTSGGRKVNTQDHIVKEKTSEVAVIVNEANKEEVAEVVAPANIAHVVTVEKTQDVSTEQNNNVFNITKIQHKKKQTLLANSKALFAIKSSKLAVSKLQMNETKFIEKKGNKTSRVDDRQLLLIILAILLPPLAVFLKKGLDTMFWISLLLTILFWFPGVIFALLVVCDVI
jgi:uncharacterized membrane protein YqaE (UPF0057 family)